MQRSAIRLGIAGRGRGRTRDRWQVRAGVQWRRSERRAIAVSAIGGGWRGPTRWELVMRDEAVDNIELRRTKGEERLSRRMREWYPFVVPADNL